ncbi:transposase [Rickettsia endosymbiont of Urophora cardui]|uniref:transposase n=1 Tax=Rickettsia endosymbiont of Urophora cardui TaxID=3066265 RepID=UPI00397DF96D
MLTSKPRLIQNSGLCPSLKPGQCVIMDNASIHKSPLVKELIEKAGCTLIYRVFCNDCVNFC